MKKTFLPNLKTCLILDVIGCLSYIIPPLSPVWAIISGIIFYLMFGKKFGLFGKILESGKKFIKDDIKDEDFLK